MRLVFGLVLIVGLALAGTAVWMVQGYVSTAQQQIARERAARLQLGELVEVYMVTKPLAYGDAIQKADVEKVLIPTKALPEGTFTDEAALFPGDYAQPRYVLRQLEKSELILAAKITEPGEDIGLTSRLPAGMRAFAIRVDVASGVSGFVRPGDFVDVYWTGNTPNSAGEITQMIESTVRVVATDQVDQTERKDAMVARTVTVVVSPQQVARLAQAQATGRLALSLVGAGDTTEVAGVEVDSRALLGITEQAPVEIERERVCTIRTRRGSEVVEIPIACTN
ncbi:Flp pilus assembly protein CpaB [Szabonella alba]|uniref:Flp pilus assembly protein CpaB n=1 Tax=Szabonella alba TaxID=2804194 RepID=A0A8K0VAZ4_9RHOB|nr:Flp pilus assembly protein CpaB [Szabonella alba]MBL4916454.1 Flp pilus assembly protein CpaB [Szabonella alba]